MAIHAASGTVLWQKSGADTDKILPTTLAVAGGRVFFQNPREIVCLDAQSGGEHWRAARPVTMNRWAWSAPTLVVHSGVVLSADRDASASVTDDPKLQDKLLWPDRGGGVSRWTEDPQLRDKPAWVVHSDGGHSRDGQIVAFSASDGRKLWSAPCHEPYNCPVDVFVAQGLAWWGNLLTTKDEGITKGRDLVTGAIGRTISPPAVRGGHHRCFRDKATDRYLVLGRDGMEFVDLVTGDTDQNSWVRGVCQYGMLPCNGLEYAPPHSCACFIEGKLNGFNAWPPSGSLPPCRPTAMMPTASSAVRRWIRPPMPHPRSLIPPIGRPIVTMRPARAELLRSCRPICTELGRPPWADG